MALHSATVQEKPELFKAIQEAKSAGWKLEDISKPSLELIYAEFDDELENAVKSEFIADPTYLIDLGNAYGVCPLCGHVGCRWIFRLENTKGGKNIECGSECIITHGLHVKGAETAEHAKKLLEARIRKEIRKLQIKAWHEEYEFSEGMFKTLEDELWAVNKNYDLPYNIRSSAYYKAKYDLPKLRKFYDKNGWLGTEKRWAEWRRLANFARVNTEKSNLPFPKEWVKKEKKSKSKKAEAVESGEAVEAAKPVITEPVPPPMVEPEPEAKKSAGQMNFVFSGIASDLVFGENGDA